MDENVLVADYKLVKWEQDVRQMFCSSLGFSLCDAQFMHESPCQGHEREQKLRANLIIEKKQIGMWGDLYIICSIPLFV